MPVIFFFNSRGIQGGGKGDMQNFDIAEMIYLGMFARLIKKIILKWNFRNGKNQ